MNILAQIKEIFSRYAEVYMKLFKINFIRYTSGAVSYILYAFIGLFVFFCFVLFAGFGLSELFVELGLSRLYALLSVTGCYLFLLLLLLVFRKGIIRFCSSRIVRIMTEQESGNGMEASSDNEEEE